jgi:hypothetical protein
MPEIQELREAKQSLSARLLRAGLRGRVVGMAAAKRVHEAVATAGRDALIGMDHTDTSVVALFEDQIRIERVDPYPAIGLGGDSGSLVMMKEESRAVGLYFAGPPGGTYGVANHILETQQRI